MIGLAAVIAVNLLENIQMDQDNLLEIFEIDQGQQDANLPIANLAAELKECPAYDDIVSNIADPIVQHAKEKCDMDVLEKSFSKFLGCQLSKMDFNNMNFNNMDFSNMDFNNMDINNMDFNNIFNNMDFKNMDFNNMEINNPFATMDIIEPMMQDPCKTMKNTWLVS